MKDLNFDTGVVTYNLNGTCEVSFNPTDSTFAEKLFNAFGTLDQKQEDYKARAQAVKTAEGKRELFDLANAMDAEMRDIINETFGQDVCTALFGEMNVYSLADGLPVWANLMLTVMDEMDSAFAREQKAQSPRIRKYSAKYHK